VGGVVGALVAVAIVVYLVKRRSAGGDSGSGGLRATWSNPTYTGALVRIWSTRVQSHMGTHALI